MREKRRKKKSKIKKKYQNSKENNNNSFLSSPYEANVLLMYLFSRTPKGDNASFFRKDDWNLDHKKMFLTAQPSKIKGTAPGHEAHVLDPLPV